MNRLQKSENILALVAVLARVAYAVYGVLKRCVQKDEQKEQRTSEMEVSSSKQGNLHTHGNSNVGDGENAEHRNDEDVYSIWSRTLHER
jgi:hypothetical protein